MLLTTLNTIRTLQRKLYAQAKQETANVTRSKVECAGATSSVALARRETGQCACLGVKSIGKPCAGKSHARFDEGGQAKACPLLYPFDFAFDFDREAVGMLAQYGAAVSA